VLRHFGLDKYFDYIAGASMNGSEDLKWQILNRALSAVDAEKNEAILVGDRKYDAEGAKICGIDSLGVLWGHGSRRELESADFTYIAESSKEVEGLLV
jgi:phosphoglycolate phosphatase